MGRWRVLQYLVTLQCDEKKWHHLKTFQDRKILFA